MKSVYLLGYVLLLMTSSAARAGGNIPFAFMPLPGDSVTAPSYVQEAETVWNTSTSPKTTASFSVQAGDVLVAYAIAEGYGPNLGISGGSLTWVERQMANATNYSEVRVWTATVDSNKSMTVSFTCNGSQWFGGNVLTFRGSAGVGASSMTMVSSGAPALNITTVNDNSTVVVAIGDWNGGDGATRTWRLSTTEASYFWNSSHYTAYGGYKPSIGIAGTYSVGLSLPTGQKYSIVAVEVRGTGGPNPCLNASPPPIGTNCDGGPIYAGQFDGGKYMITPGGCTDSSTPTCAGGTDTLQKNWIGTGGSRQDIAGVTNVASSSTKSSSSERGHVTTPIITAHASIASDSAADFCENMVYGGYSDWYLPSKSEAAYIYCHSQVSNHDSNNPQEEADCVSYGGKTSELPGFAFVNNYATSTEADADTTWEQGFINGFQGNGWKDGNRYVRCIRRY